MGVVDKVEGLKELKGQIEKLIKHKERVFSSVDEEMYLLSKSEKTEKKRSLAQKNLAIFIIAELLESFDEKEQKEILEIFKKVFESP